MSNSLPYDFNSDAFAIHKLRKNGDFFQAIEYAINISAKYEKDKEVGRAVGFIIFDFIKLYLTQKDLENIKRCLGFLHKSEILATDHVLDRSLKLVLAKNIMESDPKTERKYVLGLIGCFLGLESYQSTVLQVQVLDQLMACHPAKKQVCYFFEQIPVDYIFHSCQEKDLEMVVKALTFYTMALTSCSDHAVSLAQHEVLPRLVPKNVPTAVAFKLRAIKRQLFYLLSKKK